MDESDSSTSIKLITYIFPNQLVVFSKGASINYVDNQEGGGLSNVNDTS